MGSVVVELLARVPCSCEGGIVRHAMWVRFDREVEIPQGASNAERTRIGMRWWAAQGYQVGAVGHVGDLPEFPGTKRIPPKEVECGECGGTGEREIRIPISPRVRAFLTGEDQEETVAPLFAEVLAAARTVTYWKRRADGRGFVLNDRERADLDTAVETLSRAGYKGRFPAQDELALRIVGTGCLNCRAPAGAHWHGLCMGRVEKLLRPNEEARRAFESLPDDVRWMFSGDEGQRSCPEKGEG